MDTMKPALIARVWYWENFQVDELSIYDLHISSYRAGISLEGLFPEFGFKGSSHFLSPVF